MIYIQVWLLEYSLYILLFIIIYRDYIVIRDITIINNLVVDNQTN